jgi:hypothetical protein
MVSRLLVSISVDQCLIIQLAYYQLALIQVGLGVQPLQGENYTYSRVLGHGQPYFSITLIRVLLPDFYLRLVNNFLPRVAEVRGVGVLELTLWFWKMCVGPGNRDVGTA